MPTHDGADEAGQRLVDLDTEVSGGRGRPTVTVTAPLVFGVFPLGLAGSPGGVASGPPDDFGRIAAALEELGGDGPSLLVRMYVSWDGRASTERVVTDIAALTASPAPIDLVLCYRDPNGDVGGWADFVGRVVAVHGRDLAAIQVTGEANLTNIPAAADGAYPRAADALVDGVLAAAATKARTAATAAVGFAVSPEIDPANSPFWAAVARCGGENFARAVDYAGLDMYPDVFGPRIPLAQLKGAVDWLLRSFRNQALPICGIGPDVPIRICENGWPTGPGRSEETQADVLEAILRAVNTRRHDLNVTHWELFTLRDADTHHDGLFHHFGILRDDYSPKPAYSRLRRLLEELQAH